jgi:hypothetical protein
MSPEQLLGDPIDARSDLYALGCILHLMLTAAPPFAAPTREQMIKRRLSEEAPHIQHLDPGLPDSLDRVVHRLLARSPGERYASAAEVRDELAGTHVRRSAADVPPRMPAVTPRSAPTQAFESAALAPTEQTEQARRPRGRQVALVGGLLALAAAAFAMLDSRDDSAAAVTPGEVRGAATQPAPAAAAVIPPAAVPAKPAVLVDSVALAAKRTADRILRQRRDSLNKARAAITAAAVAATTPRAAPAAGSVEGTIARYADAIESGLITRLKEAYPGLTDDQQKYWETTVFSRATKIRARVADLKPRTGEDDAEVDFRLDVRFEYADGQGANFTLDQHAELKRTPTGWQIASIRGR